MKRTLLCVAAGVHWPRSRCTVQKPSSPRAASSHQMSHGFLGSLLDNRSVMLGGMLAIARSTEILQRAVGERLTRLHCVTNTRYEIRDTREAAHQGIVYSAKLSSRLCGHRKRNVRCAKKIHQLTIFNSPRVSS